MDEWLIIAALLAGAILGSFLCLVIERFPVDADGRRWLARICHPASACSMCGHRLALRDLVPLLSWVILRGCCRYCHQPISRYPYYLESGTALLLALIAFSCPPPALFAWLTLFSCAVLVLSEIDRRHLLLPDAITLPLLWCGLLFNWQLSPLHLQQAVAGAICGYLSFRGLNEIYLWLRKQDGMGLGDAKFFAALGAWTGWLSLPLIATLAALIGIVVWLVSRLKGQKTIRQPFGPCLSVAGWSLLIAQHGESDWFSFIV
ncbi:prepilin peptidase [Winslowiella iniecta]|uniref:Prepilin leader peptidase/N-methyltransferase n=1 Tax=Winslowiella iniecta TaxID=1560201 RepID=A0A0L7SZ09_9GAMM|nr:A24 family peptidase [Winslowiella iniecta]KOC87425.1 hypothetical protein NG42_20555 [Winslowiella iniecta]KOC88338.1 hypothetical protein NG43_20250 [Winslowiella iniecta]